ncbi:MAG: hydrogenase maturation protease [Acidobacteria bacterium]|nr:hydrogenase maturation protease [Acidobacteriota bacterium]
MIPVKPILVAGIGNIFLGDDAFGVHAARRLIGYDLPDEVYVADFGIRGIDLAYALADGYELVILLDATKRGGAPGTLYLIEPDPEAMEPAGLPDAHSMDPELVLRFARRLGWEPGHLYLVGCEPYELERQGLSKVVEASLDGAIEMVQRLIRDYLE